jgi:hypothetical protein
MSPTFVSRFVSMEQMMAYDPNGELEDDTDEDGRFMGEDGWFMGWFMEYSVPTMMDKEGNYYFHTLEHMSIFIESHKKEILSQKRCAKHKYVTPRHVPQVRHRMCHYRR